MVLFRNRLNECKVTHLLLSLLSSISPLPILSNVLPNEVDNLTSNDLGLGALLCYS